MSPLTFDVLAAFALQSSAVALIALGVERLMPKADALSRRFLWGYVWIGGIGGPLAFSAFPGGRFLSDYEVVLAIESVSRSAPASARIAAIWVVAAGALLLALWRVCGLVRLHRIVGGAQPLAPGEELAGEIALLERKLWATADYRVSSAVEGPLMCSFWRRPVILLPEGFTAMPAPERMGILAHELVHVRRRDWLKLVVEEGARCLLWFTPAIHILLRRGRVAREMWTDALAVGATGDRGAYLNALVEIARRPIQADALVAPLFLEPRSLKGRVAALLEARPMSKTRRIVTFLALVFSMPFAGDWARDAFPSRLAAAQGTVHKVGGDVIAPRLLTKVEPAYSPEAKDASLEGTVLLSVEVHPDGRAYNIQVQQGLGMGLDEQAVAAIEQWTFEPGVKDGRKVIVGAMIEVNFKLK